MDGDFCASVCAEDELAVARATTWVPAAAGSVSGEVGVTSGGFDVLPALGSDWLLTDTGSDFGCGAAAARAELADPESYELLTEGVAGFGVGVTTADGTFAWAAVLSADAEPAGVVPPVDWDMPGAVGAVLSAVEAVPCWVGTLAVPGDPRAGKTVPSCKLPRSGCAAVGGEDTFAPVELATLSACSSGNLIGAPGGGGAGKPVAESWPASIGGAAGRRPKILTIPPDAPAACAPCPAPAIAFDAVLTISTTRFPSECSTYGCVWSKSTTTRVTGGFALFRPSRTRRTPL